MYTTDNKHRQCGIAFKIILANTQDTPGIHMFNTVFRSMYP